MSDNHFTKFVPGFEFLQGLVKNAGAALPGIGQWVAPTLNPEEIAKRIEELRTVQFWLEQNARMMAATIQALEVQRMTLSTLQSMNVPLADLRDSLKLATPGQASPAPMAGWPGFAQAPSGPSASFAPSAPSAPAAPIGVASPLSATSAAAAAPTAAAPNPRGASSAPATPPAMVDPTQWWTALSQQFTQLATAAMKDTATDAAKNLAGSFVKQSLDAAGGRLRKAATVPGSMVGSVAKGLAAGAKTANANRTAKRAQQAAGEAAARPPAAKAAPARVSAKRAPAVRRKP